MKAMRWLLAAALVASASAAQAQDSDIYLLSVTANQMVLADPTQIKDHGSYREGTYVAILPQTSKQGIDFLKAQIQHDCSRPRANKIVIFQGFSLDDSSEPVAIGSPDTEWVTSDDGSFAGTAWTYACKKTSDGGPYPNGFRGIEQTASEYRGFLRKRAQGGE